MSAAKSRYLLLLIITGLGLFLRLYHLSATMPFIGDQAWFYLSARDALLTGRLPLLGITASVTWLHQGPLWTYFLIPALALSRFNPLSGGVLTVFISTTTIILSYLLGRLWFSPRAGLVAAFVFAVSPLAVIHARMPYHTSLIPFFMALMLLFLSRRRYLWSFFLLALLFQLELAAAVFWPVFLVFLVRERYQPRFRDLFAFALGLLPLLLSGPVQTGGVFIWLVYHFLTHSPAASSPGPFYLNLLSRFYLPGLPGLALPLLVAALLFALYRRRLTGLWLLLPLAGVLLTGVPSEAYFSLLLLPLSLFSGYLLAALFRRNLLLVFFTGWWLINSHYLLSRDFQIDPGSYGAAFSSRLAVSDRLLQLSLTSSPGLTAVGPGSQFSSTPYPFRYLIWWRGLTVRPGGTHLKFEINDSTQTYRVLQ